MLIWGKFQNMGPGLSAKLSIYHSGENHGGKSVCHLLQELKVPGSRLGKKNYQIRMMKCCEIFEIPNTHRIVCVYLWLETTVSWVYIIA